MHHHQQLPKDVYQALMKDVSQLLGLLARLAYDQFVRVLAKSIGSRRENIVLSIHQVALSGIQEQDAFTPIQGL